MKKQKRKYESYSDVIARLLENQSNFSEISQCFGLSKDLPDEFTNEFRQASREMRESIRTRVDSK